jgi:hypothetical protein
MQAPIYVWKRRLEVIFAEMGTKRSRDVNFTDRQLRKIVNLVDANYTTISSKFNDTVRSEKKAKIWKEMSRRVNSVGPVLRSQDAEVGRLEVAG